MSSASSSTPDLSNSKEKWGSKLGVVLAVAGSAVGLGNFLRFPGQAVSNGGGAFMIPYIISFILLGIPIAWIEWTMGRMGSRLGQNSAPGIMYGIWRRAPAKGMGGLAILIPVVIYMYYVLLEAWCLDYCIEFARGGFSALFAKVTAGATTHQAQVDAVVGATNDFFKTEWGMNGHGVLLEGGRVLWVVLLCFFGNFFIIYHGVTRGIERFCKYAMPALIICALVILGRVLTLPNIASGLGFMWNPKWGMLRDPQVWLNAAGQIFFSLSVGFGIIVCYASYLRENDDVVLTALSASSTNEFCEVILGGLIVVPTAFLFLGAGNATGSTFGLGFVTFPAIMNFMHGWGSFVGALWFGLLFIAAITSSLSMLQPAIAFLEDGFGLKRRASVAILAAVTAGGTAGTMYFSKGALALDTTDFWCNLSMIILAACEVLMFGWIVGAERGVREMNRGADLHVPSWLSIIIRYVTPAFLLIVLGAWAKENLPDRIRQMSPQTQGIAAQRAEYAKYITAHFEEGEGHPLADDVLQRHLDEILGPEGEAVHAGQLPEWLRNETVTVTDEEGEPEKVTLVQAANHARDDAMYDANIARYVFLGIVLFFLVLVVLADIACRGRIGSTLARAEADGNTLDTIIDAPHEQAVPPRSSPDREPVEKS